MPIRYGLPIVGICQSDQFGAARTKKERATLRVWRAKPGKTESYEAQTFVAMRQKNDRLNCAPKKRTALGELRTVWCRILGGMTLRLAELLQSTIKGGLSDSKHSRRSRLVPADFSQREKDRTLL